MSYTAPAASLLWPCVLLAEAALGLDPMGLALINFGGVGLLAGVLLYLHVTGLKASREDHAKLIEAFQAEQHAERVRCDQQIHELWCNNEKDRLERASISAAHHKERQDQHHDIMEKLARIEGRLELPGRHTGGSGGPFGGRQ